MFVIAGDAVEDGIKKCLGSSDDKTSEQKALGGVGDLLSGICGSKDDDSGPSHSPAG